MMHGEMCFTALLLLELVGRKQSDFVSSSSGIPLAKPSFENHFS